MAKPPIEFRPFRMTQAMKDAAAKSDGNTVKIRLEKPVASAAAGVEWPPVANLKELELSALEAYKAQERAKVLARVKRHRAKKDKS